jgi:hypothetical protein
MSEFYHCPDDLETIQSGERCSSCFDEDTARIARIRPHYLDRLARFADDGDPSAATVLRDTIDAVRNRHASYHFVLTGAPSIGNRARARSRP